MQTFLPYSDFKKSAACLDYKRLGKQRIETRDILVILGGYKPDWINEKQYIYLNKRYKNHPAVKMWAGYSQALSNYGLAMCLEWMERGYNDTSYQKIYQYGGGETKVMNFPKWLGNNNFHLSHKSNLVRKNSLYYKPIFGNDIPDNLPYIWPIK